MEISEFGPLEVAGSDGCYSCELVETWHCANCLAFALRNVFLLV